MYNVFASLPRKIKNMNEIILYDTPFNDFVVMRPEELLDGEKDFNNISNYLQTICQLIQYNWTNYMFVKNAHGILKK